MNKHTLRGAAVTGGVVALIGFLLWEDLFLSSLGNFFQGNFYWFFWFLAAAVVLLIALGFSAAATEEQDKRTQAYQSDPYRKDVPVGRSRIYKRTAVRLCIVGGFLLVVAVFFMFRQGYVQDQALLSHVTISKEAPANFKERAAQQVAKNGADKNVSIDGELVDGSVTYIGDKQYTSLFRKVDSVFSGYAGVQVATLDLTGDPKSTACQFSDNATARLGGWFGHNLKRQIAHIKRGYTITVDDAYGLCATVDGKVTPLVVVPLKDHKGWFPAIEVPAGVAVYNGLTGKIDIYDEVKDGHIDGPVFPSSLSEHLRDATTASEGWWRHFRGTAGWADTSARDADDPNEANPADFVLEQDTTNGGSSYVTALMKRRGTKAITALGVVDASTVTRGQLNEYVIHDLPQDRVANSTVATRLRAEYDTLPWQSGMGIFEVTPVKNDEWVVSLGQKQNVQYRARVKADGSSCLEDAAGNQLACGRSPGGPGLAREGGTTAGTTTSAAGGDLKGLTDAQLKDQMQRLLEEYNRRLTSK